MVATVSMAPVDSPTLVLSPASSALCLHIGAKSCSIGRTNFRQIALSRWRWQRRSASELRVVSELTTNAPRKSPSRKPKVVIMVDPLEAKRLAAEEWKLLQDRVRFRRQRKIEAINGGWAMLGLTAGVVIEGYTGDGILVQVANYVDTVFGYLDEVAPPGF